MLDKADARQMSYLVCQRGLGACAHLTPKYCAASCKAKGYTLAGLEVTAPRPRVSAGDAILRLLVVKYVFSGRESMLRCSVHNAAPVHVFAGTPCAYKYGRGSVPPAMRSP